MQPTAQTGIVWKISIFLFILLAVVLYKMNDYFKQEKYAVTQTQLRTQIVTLKTSVASQISTLKNVLSSYEYDLSESKINWVQLDPFFGIAKAERVGPRGSGDYRITQFIGRSGSLGANWNASFLQRVLSRQMSNGDQLITIQIFRDTAGAKFMSLRFANPNGRAVVVVGGADYFQKFFDLSRGARMTSLLQTADQVLAAHSEADYLGSSMDENAVSEKKFLVEKEEIAGTNLTAMSFVNRKNLTKGFMVPWSVVGLIFGFGFLIIGVLIYTLEPIERRIEKYKMQEREQIFKETLSASLAQQVPIAEVQDKTQEITREDLSQAIEPPPVAEPPVVRENTGTGTASLTFQQVNPPPPPIELHYPVAPSSVAMVPTPKEEMQKPSVGSGSIVLDSSEIETFDYMPPEADSIDLDKALALDDIETEEVAKNSVQVVQENLTSKSINAHQQISDLTKPSFAVRRKEFRVDAADVTIRRPGRS